MELFNDYWKERFSNCKGNWGEVESVVREVYNSVCQPLQPSMFPILAGGCFASLYLKGSVKDFDIFLYRDDYANSLERLIHYGATLMSHKKSSSTIRLDSVVFELINCNDTQSETLAGFDFGHCKSFFNGEFFDIRKDIIENKSIILSGQPIDPYNSVKNSSSYTRILRLLRDGWVLAEEVEKTAPSW